MNIRIFKAVIKKYLLHISIISFFIIVSFSFYIAGQIYHKEIKENEAFTTGQITGYKSIRGAYSLRYTYTVNGTTYKNIGSPMRIAAENYKYFKGKYFPVVYSKINPYKNSILIEPYNFEYWGLRYPDSLEWVKGYLYF